MNEPFSQKQGLKDLESFLGAPYVDRGIDEEAGFDCINVLRKIAENQGLTINESRNYSNYPKGMGLYDTFCKYFDVVERSDLKICDVILFSSSGLPSHVGVVSDVEPVIRFIHALNSGDGKVVKDHLAENSRWNERICAYFRFKNLIEDLKE